MPQNPWWIDRVAALLSPADLSPLELGALWRLSERLAFVRQSVDLALLQTDFEEVPDAARAWAAFGVREAETHLALLRAGGLLAERMRSGQFGAQAFRAHWEGLGFLAHPDGAGTPADDFLEGVFRISRLKIDEVPPALGLLNLGSRAERVADFLAVTHPGETDVVIDLGSGSGKLALTVAASSLGRVLGVELIANYVTAARRSAAFLGIQNADFVEADACSVDLSAGNIFYLYHPFRGPAAEAVAIALGREARARNITIYSSGPNDGYGEYFLAQVERGAMRLEGRRGEFGEVMLLRSP